MPFDTPKIETIRKDFPQLTDNSYHFLDSAASSLTPTKVIEAMNVYYINDRANVHRGLYGEAVRATERFEDTRGAVGAFINAFADEIIFTSGATESSNMLTRSIEETLELKEGDEIVTTQMEHHSGVVPLIQLAKRKKLVLKYIPMKGVGLDYDVAASLITDRTKLVSVMLASNVTGTINDIAKIGDMAHAKGALMITDATAALGHIPVDVRTLHVDALYFSAHKMFGPTGVGVLWIKHDLINKLEPSVFGGHMIEEVGEDKATWAPAPTKFEAGTKDIGGVIGFRAALDYLTQLDVKNIHSHTSELVTYAIAQLKSIEGVILVTAEDPNLNTGIVSFSASFAHPHDIAQILAGEHVAVRAGHHCAMPIHAALVIKASTRASFHAYNSKEDIDALIAGINKAKKIFS